MSDSPATSEVSPTTGWPTVAVASWLLAMLAFTITWLILGLVSTGYTMFDIVIEGYSPVSQPISGLGLGSTAGAMNAAFIGYGAIAVAGALGAGRLLASIGPGLQRPAAITFCLHGLGSILVGVFTLETIGLHSLGFMFVLAPVVGFLLLGRQLGHQRSTATVGRVLLRFATPLSVVLIALFFASFNPEAAGENTGIAGLTQRALIIDIQVWIATLIVVGWRHLARDTPR